MSKKIKDKIGEELYNKILEAGLKETDFDLVNDGNWVPRGKMNKINEDNKAYMSKIGQFEKQLNETKELLANSEEYKTKYSELENKHKEELSNFEKKLLTNNKRALVQAELTARGVKGSKLLLNEIDITDGWEKLSIENDKLIGFSDMVEGFEKEYSYMFPKITKGSDNNDGPDGNNNNNNQDFDEDYWDKKFENL